MEVTTVAKEDVVYPAAWSPTQASTIQQAMGRPVGEPLIAVDRTSHIIYASPSTTDMFGWEIDDLLGLPLNALIPQRHHHDHNAHVAAFIDGSSTGRTIERPGLNARQSNGAVFEITLTIARIGTPDNPVLVASMRPRGAK